MKRPASLVEVTALSETTKQFGYAVAEFVDQFNIEWRKEMLAEEPPAWRAQLNDEGLADSYLAASANALDRA